MNRLQINTAIQVMQTIGEVFEAVADPVRMAKYFISEGSDRMEEGKIVRWKFPEFEETFEIKVLKVIPEDLISFEWEGIAGRQTMVEISFTKVKGGFTLVKITEGFMQADDTGIRWLGQNTEGWANFLACLKAYLEYGINLRNGSFDFMKPAEPL